MSEISPRRRTCAAFSPSWRLEVSATGREQPPRRDAKEAPTRIELVYEALQASA
jgi:hypothetical protein